MHYTTQLSRSFSPGKPTPHLYHCSVPPGTPNHTQPCVTPLMAAQQPNLQPPELPQILISTLRPGGPSLLFPVLMPLLTLGTWRMGSTLGKKIYTSVPFCPSPSSYSLPWAGSVLSLCSSVPAHWPCAPGHSRKPELSQCYGCQSSSHQETQL